MSVFIVEPMKAWTVDIEDTDYFPAAVDGNDYFGIRGRVTSDMSRECVDIWHKHCAVFCDSSTTDSLSYFDLYACRFSLEWSENQSVVFQKVESYPVNVAQCSGKKCGSICEICGQVRNSVDQSGQLF